MKRAVILILAVMMMLLCLFGCGKQRCNVDYCGSKSLFGGARDSYRAGAKVRLRYELLATDTDYTFCLDGEPIKVGYDGGYIIEFTMPAHDVKLTVKTVNSMIYVPETEADGE